MADRNHGWALWDQAQHGDMGFMVELDPDFMGANPGWPNLAIQILPPMGGPCGTWALWDLELVGGWAWTLWDLGLVGLVACGEVDPDLVIPSPCETNLLVHPHLLVIPGPCDTNLFVPPPPCDTHPLVIPMVIQAK